MERDMIAVERIHRYNTRQNLQSKIEEDLWFEHAPRDNEYTRGRE
jgi:hypothetical protein